jgi:hypothetical protein
MSKKSKYYKLHLHRSTVTYEPKSLSDAGSAEREGWAYVIRVDNCSRVTYAAATPAVRPHASTVKKGAVRKVSGARQHLAAIADNTRALGLQFARLAGSRDALGSAAREGRASVMRVDNRVRVTDTAATPAAQKISGARQYPATIADNANALG